MHVDHDHICVPHEHAHTHEHTHDGVAVIREAVVQHPHPNGANTCSCFICKAFSFIS